MPLDKLLEHRRDRGALTSIGSGANVSVSGDEELRKIASFMNAWATTSSEVPDSISGDEELRRIRHFLEISAEAPGSNATIVTPQSSLPEAPTIPEIQQPSEATGSFRGPSSERDDWPFCPTEASSALSPSQGSGTQRLPGKSVQEETVEALQNLHCMFEIPPQERPKKA